jgi:3-oxoacyl-[acyl-carrier-protein] synthase II
VTDSPIVITGAAAATCLGLDRKKIWAAVVQGQCGMGEMKALEIPHPPEKSGGQCPELPGEFEPGLPREVRYLRWTLRDALSDAGLGSALPYEPARCGIMLGTTLHGMRAAGQYLRSQDFSPLKDFLAAHTLAGASAGFGLKGFSATTCSACSSSLGAIALAVTLLRAGD